MQILLLPALLSSTATVPNEPLQAPPAALFEQVAQAPVDPAAPTAISVQPAPDDGGIVSDTLNSATAVPDDSNQAVDGTEAAPVEQEAPFADGSTIIVTARQKDPQDPVEVLNAASYEAVQAVDDAVIAPVTHVYMDVVPSPIQQGLHNFLNNLDEPIVFLNFLLQLKVGKAFETLGRFTINSTLGLGGLVDVAKTEPFNLPRRSNGLADTLGYYGVEPGPYLFLPLIGSTTVRDLVARPFDLLLVPTVVGKPFIDPTFSAAKSVLSALDERAQNDEKLKEIREESNDPYVAAREAYLTRRQAEIDVLKGKRTSVDDPTPPVKKKRKNGKDGEAANEPVAAPLAQETAVPEGAAPAQDIAAPQQ